jgi:DNA-binding response OmpR family regulator
MAQLLMMWRTIMHVLVVEDDAVLADGLSRVLGSHGMAVEVVGNGVQADQLLQRAGAAAEVVVLDIGLPGMDGFEVVRRLRARGNAVPVLLLTARDAVEDRVRGLEQGADDYLVKPFATAELVARVKALARRHTAPQQRWRWASCRWTWPPRARVGDKVIELSVREWAVLEYLLQHASRVVSKQQIIDAILPWGDDITPNAVEVYISRLRLKIADAGVAIRTIRGFGYMLEPAA